MLFASTRVAAQGTPEALLDVADAYLRQENYEASATEYQRFLFFAPDHPAVHYAFFQLGVAEQRLGRQQEAVLALRRAARTAPDGRVRRHISYRLALAYLASGQPDRAKMELLELVVDPQDTTLATQSSLIAAVAFAYQQRWEQTGELFQTASDLQFDNAVFRERIGRARQLSDLLTQEEVAKSPRGAKWASTFVPGSGQIYAGRIWNGLTSFAINLGTSYMLYRLVESHSYRDAALWASSVWWRYYQGNRLHAEGAAIQANEQYQEGLENEMYLLLREASGFIATDTFAPTRPVVEGSAPSPGPVGRGPESPLPVATSAPIRPAGEGRSSSSGPVDPVSESYDASEPGLPRLVALGADWCIPCRAMEPIRAELRREYAGHLEVDFYDVGEDPEAGAHFGVQVIPTLIYYDQVGRELGRQQGYASKDLILANMKQFGMRLTRPGG